MTSTDAPTWAKRSWAYAASSLPQPGPVRASERRALRRARRPKQPRHTFYKGVYERHGKEQLERELERIAIRKSLPRFVRTMWDVLEPGTALQWNWHLDVICEALERVSSGKCTRLLINVPPGHMKSLLVSVFWPAWIWLENPGWRSIYATYVQDLSDRDARRTRDLVTSDAYQDLIPKLYGEGWNEAWDLKDDNNQVRTFSTTMHGFRLATSVGGLGAGVRGDCVIFDDPMNTDEYVTPEALIKVTSWWDKRMSSRLNDMKTGALVGIMQRLHENDLAGHILAQQTRELRTPATTWIPYEHICLRSEYDPERPNTFDRRRERGELLFPAKFPKEVLSEARVKLGPGQYSAQHDQDPIPQGGALIPVWRLGFWYPKGTKAPPAHLEKDDKGNLAACLQSELPESFETECQSWDCTFKDTKTSDFVAGQYWARRLAKCYLLEQTHGRLSFTATVNAILAMSAAHPLGFSKYVEDKANGTAVMDVLQEKVFGLIPIEPKGGKVARANACTPFIHAGNIFLPHPALYPWVHDLLAELRAFPLGAHDDQVDAMTQALAQIAVASVDLMRAMTRM